jgi:hypothetical protein
LPPLTQSMLLNHRAALSRKETFAQWPVFSLWGGANRGGVRAQPVLQQ